MPDSDWNGSTADWNTPGAWDNGVPDAGTDAFFDTGTGTCTVSDAETANSIDFNAAGATLDELAAGSLTIGNSLTIEAGTVKLNGANSFGNEVVLNSGTLDIGNSGALGTGQFVLGGGVFAATGNLTVANALDLFNFAEIDVSTSKQTKLNGGLTLDGFYTGTQFGNSAFKGTLVLAPTSFTNGSSSYGIDINGGSVKIGSAAGASFFDNAASIEKAKGTTLDINGHSVDLEHGTLKGTILDSGANATLSLGGGTLYGPVTPTGLPNIAFKITDNENISASCRVVKTVIESGKTLVLEGNGRLTGPVTDNGFLTVFNAQTALGPISGDGELIVGPGGTLTISGSNPFTGELIDSGGTLDINKPAGIGPTVPLILEGNPIVHIGQSMTLKNPVNAQSLGFEKTFLDGNSTIVLRGNFTGNGESLSFLGNGTAQLAQTTMGAQFFHLTIGGAATVDVQTTAAAKLFGNVQSDMSENGTTTVNGTLNAGTVSMTIIDPEGTGTIDGSGGTIVLKSNTGLHSVFAGILAGGDTVEIKGDIELSGSASFTKIFKLAPNALLTLDKAFPQDVQFGTTSRLEIKDKYRGHLRDFQHGDYVVFDSLTYDSSATATYTPNSGGTGGTLTIATQSGTRSVKLTGHYKNGDFQVHIGPGLHGVEVTPKAGVTGQSTTADQFHFSSLVHEAAGGSHAALAAIDTLFAAHATAVDKHQITLFLDGFNRDLRAAMHDSGHAQALAIQHLVSDAHNAAAEFGI